MSPKRKWFVAAIKLAIVVVLVWSVRRSLGLAISDVRKHSLHLNPVWLAAAGGIYLLAILPSALFWYQAIRAMGQPVGLFAAIRAYYIGHVGKYVPGKALVVVLRAGLVRGSTVSGAVAAIAVFVETLTMMASGSFLAAALIAVQAERNWLYVAGAIAFMLASGLPTLPPVYKRLVRLTRIGRANPEAADRLERIHYRTLLSGWLATGIGWIVMGLSLTAVLRGMGQTSTGWITGLPLATMVVCLSVVACFMSFIPGGLVVRDVVMAELIGRQLGPEVAVPATIVLRLVWLLAEVAAAGVLYPIHITRPKPPSPSPPSPSAPSNSPAA